MMRLVLRVILILYVVCVSLELIMRGIGALLTSHILVYWAQNTIYLLDIDYGFQLPLLTDFPHIEFSLSPDGQRIAYTCVDRNGSYICVADVASPQDERILTSNYSRSNQPAWSPDGTRIAFVSHDSSSAEIYVMNVDGSNVQQVTHVGNCHTPSWSPDATRLAFACNDGIYWITLTSGELSQLTHDWSGGYTPVWSPDGSRILFSDVDGETFALFVVDVPDNAQWQRILAEYELQPIYPQWSPDGTLIAYLGNEGFNFDRLFSALYVMNADGSEVRQVTNYMPIYSLAWWQP